MYCLRCPAPLRTAVCGCTHRSSAPSSHIRVFHFAPIDCTTGYRRREMRFKPAVTRISGPPQSGEMHCIIRSCTPPRRKHSCSFDAHFRLVLVVSHNQARERGSASWRRHHGHLQILRHVTHPTLQALNPNQGHRGHRRILCHATHTTLKAPNPKQRQHGFLWMSRHGMMMVWGSRTMI